MCIGFHSLLTVVLDESLRPYKDTAVSHAAAAYLVHILNKINLYLYRRVCVCLSVCLSVCVSFRRYTRRRLWSDRDQILHTHADSSPNGSEQNKNQPRVTQGGFGGVLGGQKFTNLE